MKTTVAWLRTLTVGEWIALSFVTIGLLAAGWGSAAGIWSTIVGSLQPGIPKVKMADYDLIAQRSMSAAAWWMVMVTSVSLAIAVLSLYLLRENLREARKVTADAARSADAAERAVEQGAKSAAETFALGKKQVKAYVSVISSAICFRDDEAILSYRLANSGQSPAYQIQIRPRMRYWADSTAEPSREYFFPTFTLNTLKTAGEREVSAKIEAKFEFREKLSVMIEFATVSYDVFEDRDDNLATYETDFTHEGEGLRAFHAMLSVAGSMI